MRAYECLYIVHPGADGSELESSAAKYSEIITTRDGSVQKVDNWGKRKLAYPINKFPDGNYILIRFEAEPEAIEELEFRLRVDDRVLRYMTCYEVPEGTGQSDELMALTERKERDRRGRGGRFGGRGGGGGGGGGGGRFGGRGGGGGGRDGGRDGYSKDGPGDRRPAAPAASPPAAVKEAAPAAKDKGGEE